MQLGCLKGEAFRRNAEFERILAALRSGTRDLGAPEAVARITGLLTTGQCPGVQYAHVHRLIDAMLENPAIAQHGAMSANLYYRKALAYLEQHNHERRRGRPG